MVLGAVARCRNYPNYVLRPGIPTWKGWDSDASLSWRDLIQVRTIPGMSPQWFGPCTAPVQLQCLDDLQGVFSYKCWGSAWHNRNHRPILRHRSKLIPAWKTIAYMALRMVFIPVQHGCHWKPSWWLSISTFKAILRVFFLVASYRKTLPPSWPGGGKNAQFVGGIPWGDWQTDLQVGTFWGYWHLSQDRRSSWGSSDGWFNFQLDSKKVFFFPSGRYQGDKRKSWNSYTGVFIM